MIGGGGAGAQANHSQFRAGSSGGNSRFQPSGSYNGAGNIIAYGGGGTPAGQGPGSGGGTQAQGGIGFSGHDGQRVRYGFGGEHGASDIGRGGTSGHGDNTYGKGADGIKSYNATNGNNGVNGFVYIIEYIGT